MYLASWVLTYSKNSVGVIKLILIILVILLDNETELLALQQLFYS